MGTGSWNSRAHFKCARVAVIVLQLLGAAAWGGEVSIEERWQEFQADPARFLDSQPPKVDTKGRPIPSRYNSPFSRPDIDTGSYVEKKVSLRKRVDRGEHVRRSRGTRSRFEGEAGVALKTLGFLDPKEIEAKAATPVFQLADMESLGLMKAELIDQPWSGSYWPIYQGMIAARYGSNDFLRRTTWKSYYDFIAKSDLASVVEAGESDAIEQLSPAEKYDLLIGDPRAAEEMKFGFLTPVMWREGERYFKMYGKVESWMGLCHGWAPAAFMEPRPEHAVNAVSAIDSLNVKFTPSDLKGLSSLLWAKAETPSSFIGGRCDRKKPKLDPETGRILQPECFDVNPALWHLITVNQIGVLKRSFVLDATYDYEVWNQPVQSYEYKYFNPQTGQEAATLAGATVAREDFTNDKFVKFRGAEARKFVGVEMSLTYVVETQPNLLDTDSEEFDETNTVRYMYDLELDKDGKIVGGEWYTNRHPDFLWVPAYQAQATSIGDASIPSGEEWKPDQPVPAFWRDIARKTAERFGVPVGRIITPLIQSSRTGPQ